MTLESYVPFYSLFVAAPLIIAALWLLWRWRRATKGKPALPPRWLALGAFVAVMIAAAAVVVDLERAAAYGRPIPCFFTYDVLVEPIPGNRTQVLLPMPPNPELLGDLRVSPPSSTASVNETGSEPALEIRFSERTTVYGSFRSERPCRIELTRGPELSNEGDFNLSITSLAGNLSYVHVSVEAYWASSCTGTWDADVVATPVATRYPGEWNVRC